MSTADVIDSARGLRELLREMGTELARALASEHEEIAAAMDLEACLAATVDQLDDIIRSE